MNVVRPYKNKAVKIFRPWMKIRERCCCYKHVLSLMVYYLMCVQTGLKVTSSLEVNTVNSKIAINDIPDLSVKICFASLGLTLTQK